jgi:hypothetical protein
MANIQVTTNQNIIEVVESGGITVTTPEGQTINVEVAASGVNVTNTTDNITVLTNGTLNITTGITDRLVAGSNQVILNTDATMSFPNNAIDFGNQSADLKSSSYSELWYRNANPSPTAGQGIQTYIWGWENQAGIAVESVDNGYLEWYFNANGTTTFPTLTVPVNDVGYTDVTGQVLKFSDPNKQAIIYGPAATTGSAQRMLLQGAPGADGSTGEGGDVYIWAGRGGSVVDAVGGGDGGDVKVRAGQGRGGASGGYVRIQGGDSDSGVGGFVDIQGGDGTGDGGYTRILSSVNTERIKVDAAGVKFNAAYTFPNADGTADQVMKTDGMGNLSFYSPSDANTTYNIDATSTTGGANFNLNGSDSTTDSIKIAAGTNITVTATDANTITIDGSDLNTTYTISSAATTGGANLTLTGSDASTDSVAYKGAGATSVTSTDANTITITSTDTNTTYTQNASSTTGGANLNLVGSDSTTDSVKFAGSGATTITRTDADTITVSSTDTNTTYSQNFSSTTGGANLNLVGSDATTDTVKFADGTGVTVAYTDANTATISIGQSVATSANPTFAGVTGGAVTVGVDTDQTISTTSGNLILQTAAGVNAGTMTLTAGANGAVTLAPNGTGSVVNTFSNGGNLSSNRSMITGAIRSGTGATAGNYIWALNGALATQPFRGVSVDNSADTAVNAGYVARNYNATAGNRSRIIFERARGTAASPTAVQSGDFIGSIEATGCNANGVFINDGLQGTATATTIPGFINFTAAETWSAGTGTGPIFGTTFGVSLAPTATAITSGTSLVPVITANPQTFASRSDAFTWANGKTGTTQRMSLDVSGNLIVSGDVRINGNDIQGSGGVNAITLSSANTNTTVVGDTFRVNNAAGTNYFETSKDGANHIVASVNQTRATAASEFAIVNFTTQRSTDGINYTPTLLNDVIGSFKFNGNANTSTSPGVPAGPGAQITAVATETWTTSANGTKFNFSAIKTGTLTDVTVISGSSDSTIFKSDAFTFQDSASTTFAAISASTAKFNVPVTTELTTTTISEGTTYTPAATVDNNISVQINTLAGGTTVIDLASLTGNSRGASYNILVFNNTASGTPLNVINSRISGSNLMSHTITTGSPRIIINAYVVGDYATATHLVVA